MSTRVRRQLRILYAEDNLDDVELLRTALDRLTAPVVLEHVDNGIACLQYLRREDGYVNAPNVDLLLLDLNMPLMDGCEVMEHIVRDEALRALPVVVLTTSASPDDVERMYRLRCSSYLRKPVELQQFLRAVQLLIEYWGDLVTLPTSGS